MKNPRSTGFTVIELVIVIVLLALFASFQAPPCTLGQLTPEMKAHRAKHDMRALGGALEDYLASHGNYPTGFINPVWALDPATRRGTSLYTLTSPVAFLPYAIPRDPYASLYGQTYSYFAKGDGWILWSPGPDGDSDLIPTRDYDPTAPPPGARLLAATYDASNGTISNGDVWRVKE